MKILIVENNARVRRMIRNLMASVASEVVECADGSEAFAAYLEHKPDWVLIDIGLKDVDVIALTSRITFVFPEAQVVILTDYNDPELRRLTQRAGACGYVLKETLFELREVVATSASQQSDPDRVKVSESPLTGTHLLKDGL